MKETDGGEGVFKHLLVMYPLMSINYVFVFQLDGLPRILYVIYYLHSLDYSI